VGVGVRLRSRDPLGELGGGGLALQAVSAALRVGGEVLPRVRCGRAAGVCGGVGVEVMFGGSTRREWTVHHAERQLLRVYGVVR